MKLWAMAILLVLALGPCVKADTTVQFAVDPSDVGPIFRTDVDFFSPDLNGMVLAGQSLSLNLVLSNQELARLFLILQNGPGGFGILAEIQTNAGTFPGFVGTTVGYLLSPDGNSIGEPQFAGRADSSDGFTAFGLSDFTPENLGGQDVLDVSGVHFDTTLPDTGFVITNTELRFVINDSSNGVKFGTAIQLPEPGTLPLVGLGFASLALFVPKRFLSL